MKRKRFTPTPIPQKNGKSNGKKFDVIPIPVDEPQGIGRVSSLPPRMPNMVYNIEYHPDLAYKFCLLGAKNVDLAELFGVDVKTIGEWLRDREEFRAAVYEGREHADANVAESLYHRARGYSHPDVHIATFEGRTILTPIVKHYPPDTRAAEFWLKNRAPRKWRDRKELTGPDGGPMQMQIQQVLLAKIDKLPKEVKRHVIQLFKELEQESEGV